MRTISPSHRDPHHPQDLLSPAGIADTAGSFASLLATVPVCRQSAPATAMVRTASLVVGPCAGSQGQAASAGSYAGFIGRSAGDGQCVALVKAINPGIGVTAGWARGASVQGNTGLRPGTVIATFDAAGRYRNATDGSSHSAIYLGQSARGVQVLDQWRGQAAAIRTIPWHNPGAPQADTGSRYYVVRPG
jgi:hypothetical protein